LTQKIFLITIYASNLTNRQSRWRCRLVVWEVPASCLCPDNGYRGWGFFSPSTRCWDIASFEPERFVL